MHAPTTDRPVGATVLLAVAVVGCVDVNPDWDRSSVGASSGEEDGSSATSSPHATATDASGSDSASVATGAPDADEGACLLHGLARCENATTTLCVDLSENPLHCGECFRDCREILGSTCIDGDCACLGGQWWAPCDGACRYVRNDARACGTGCVDCTQLDGGDARCRNGACELDD